MMSTQPPTSRSLRPFRYTKKNLYDLLPAIYRERDAELGKPLEAVMGVISEQVRVIEDNIDDLYENWFIETCDPWVVPYIGDLLEARLLNENVTGAIPERAFVANTISYRRRKGTVSMLEELAANVTGWPSKVVEYFELLETTQYINHLRPENFRTPDIRDENTLDLLGTPFDTIAHSVEVRHIDNGRGLYNIPNIGIHLYRLTAFPVYNAPAFDASPGNGMFRFNVLGLDEPLFNNPVPKTSDFQLAKEINVPTPIRRTGLFDDVAAYYAGDGAEKSIKIVADEQVVSSENITVYDLSGWWRPAQGTGLVAIDPVLGRMTFAKGWNPKDVHVSYYYGFSDEVGGGFYTRPDPDASQVTVLVGGSPQPGQVYAIKKGGPLGAFQFQTVSSALAKWSGVDSQPSAIFEVQDSEVYTESPVAIALPVGVSVELRAAQGQRPVLAMPLSVQAAQPPQGAIAASLFVNGIVFDGGSSVVPAITVLEGGLGTLTLRNCTLVPSSGASLGLTGSSNGVTTNDDLTITIDHSIVGGVSIDPSVSQAELVVQDSIVDGQNGTVAEGNLTLESVLANDHAVGEPVTATISTTVSTASSSGQPVLAVASTSGFVVGSLVLIGTGATQETGLVASVQTGTSLTLSSDLMNSHGAGDAVTMTLSTTVGAPALSGGDVLTVSQVGGFGNGLTIVVNPGGSDQETATVGSVQSGTPGVALNTYQLDIQQSTVFGGTLTFMVSLASDTIFTETILSTRRQVGCVRYCYIPPGSRVPRPYKCQPNYPPGATLAEQTALALGVQPIFTSTNYGDPGYAQLSIKGPTAIFRGADNGAEIGVFNELLQPLRIDNLNALLAEYLRFGLEAGILLVT